MADPRSADNSEGRELLASGVDSSGAADLFCAESFFQTRFGLWEVIPAQNWVVQVIKEGAAVNKLSWAAEVVEAGTDVGILTETPTLVLFVPAVDGEKIVPPHGHIAANDSALPLVASDDGQWKTKGFGHTA